jgi:hypothetical protein
MKNMLRLFLDRLKFKVICILISLSGLAILIIENISEYVYIDICNSAIIREFHCFSYTVWIKSEKETWFFDALENFNIIKLENCDTKLGVYKNYNFSLLNPKLSIITDDWRCRSTVRMIIFLLEKSEISLSEKTIIFKNSLNRYIESDLESLELILNTLQNQNPSSY